MKKAVMFLLVLFLTQINLSANNKVIFDSLYIVKIVDSELLNILDSFIEFEKNCDYYSPNLKFALMLLYDTGSDSIIHIKIDSFEGKPYSVHKNEYYFEYLDHPIFISTFINFDFGFFELTGNKKRIALDKEGKDAKEDDSFTQWLFVYTNKKFYEIYKISYCNNNSY